jgi:hypothetical protein
LALRALLERFTKRLNEFDEFSSGVVSQRVTRRTGGYVLGEWTVEARPSARHTCGRKANVH